MGPTAVEGWQPPDRGMSFGKEVHSSRWIKDYEGDGTFEEDEQIDFGYTLDYTRGPNTMTFTTPVFYLRDEDTAVIFTFEGLNYHVGPGETMNLSNVVFKYEGQSLEPMEVTESSAGYLLAVRGNQHITVTEDSFDWPDVSSNPVITTNNVGSEVWVFTDDTYGKRLTFTGFHNRRAKLLCACSSVKQGDQGTTGPLGMYAGHALVFKYDLETRTLTTYGLSVVSNCCCETYA